MIRTSATDPAGAAEVDVSRTRMRHVEVAMSTREHGVTDARPLHLLPNLGPKTARLLAEVGVALGAVEAFRRLRAMQPAPVSPNALWAMHGALTGERWDRLSPETTAELLRRLRGG